MNGKDVEPEIRTIPTSPYTEARRTSVVKEKLPDKTETKPEEVKKRKNVAKSLMNFIYNPQRRTLLGRSSLNWAKLAGFYTIFYFCLGCFFVGYLYLFSLTIDPHEPTHYDRDSTMAVRNSATVVGMDIRPQSRFKDNIIRVRTGSDQNQAISSLDLYRKYFLTQNPGAKTRKCSESRQDSDPSQNIACAFDWKHIVTTKDHPCSEENLYGFQNGKPCILVKLNKIFGWTPADGPIPFNIQELQGTDRDATASSIYITCEETYPADKAILSDMTYYSLGQSSGSSKYGYIPNYFFPYRNAKDHVQPFILVQFNDLPLDRAVSVTCRAWTPGIIHDSRGMRGLITFQLQRSN